MGGQEGAALQPHDNRGHRHVRLQGQTRHLWPAQMQPGRQLRVHGRGAVQPGDGRMGRPWRSCFPEEISRSGWGSRRIVWYIRGSHNDFHPEHIDIFDLDYNGNYNEHHDHLYYFFSQFRSSNFFRVFLFPTVAVFTSLTLWKDYIPFICLFRKRPPKNKEWRWKTQKLTADLKGLPNESSRNFSHHMY